MTTSVACSKCTHATGFIERPRLHAYFSVFPNLIVITLRPSTQSFFLRVRSTTRGADSTQIP
jgi:hypothetical protein